MKLPTLRKFNIKKPFCIYKDTRTLVTLNTVEEELWRQLNLFKVKEMANSYLFPKHPYKSLKSIRKLSQMLNEFVQQAEFFYKEADHCTTKISPLLYYYGMLNLIKAYITIKKPSLLQNKKDLGHGLYAGDRIKKNYNFSKEIVSVKKTGILTSYHECLIGRKAKNLKITNIPVKLLLGYCTDISSEYNDVFKNKKNLIHCNIHIRGSKHKAWTTIRLQKNTLKNENIYIKDLINRKPQLPANYRRVKFRLKEDNKNFILFEHKKEFNFYNNKTFKKGAREQVKCLLPFISFNYSEDNEKDYRLTLLDISNPSSSDFINFFSESIIIYLLMFYLGSIVRYQPYILDNLFLSKEGWILQSFIKTCPKKFLRYMVSDIFEEEFIIMEK